MLVSGAFEQAVTTYEGQRLIVCGMLGLVVLGGDFLAKVAVDFLQSD